LTVSLEDYVNDPDFEINRQQYKQIKEERAKAQKAPSTSQKPVETKTSDSKPKNNPSNLLNLIGIFLFILTIMHTYCDTFF